MKLSIRLLLTLSIAAFSLLGYVGQASAGLIACGIDRTASLSSAEACGYAGQAAPAGAPTGNLQAADIAWHYGGVGDDWTQVGATVDGTLSDGGFRITNPGGWGQPPLSGDWFIDLAGFWTTYSGAVISMHVGGGGGITDNWAWLITPGDTSGDWNYLTNTADTGGGLSNIKLWGCTNAALDSCDDDPTTPFPSVPEPGPLGLLGLGLLGLVLSRRKIK